MARMYSAATAGTSSIRGISGKPGYDIEQSTVTVMTTESIGVSFLHPGTTGWEVPMRMRRHVDTSRRDRAAHPRAERESNAPSYWPVAMNVSQLSWIFLAYSADVCWPPRSSWASDPINVNMVGVGQSSHVNSPFSDSSFWY